jgi:hypothetical protein
MCAPQQHTTKHIVKIINKMATTTTTGMIISRTSLPNEISALPSASPSRIGWSIGGYDDVDDRDTDDDELDLADDESEPVDDDREPVDEGELVDDCFVDELARDDDDDDLPVLDDDDIAGKTGYVKPAANSLPG